MTIVTTSGWTLSTLPPELASSLNTHAMVHVAIVVCIATITVVQALLPLLPVLLTSQQLSKENHHPASSLERSAMQGGRGVPAGLLP